MEGAICTILTEKRIKGGRKIQVAKASAVDERRRKNG
jgi:hypothetical protein